MTNSLFQTKIIVNCAIPIVELFSHLSGNRSMSEINVSGYLGRYNSRSINRKENGSK